MIREAHNIEFSVKRSENLIKLNWTTFTNLVKASLMI